ncbi:hypothetical protein [Microbacterium allomyrinae]|uniref:Uncharacterized protein n=1 Tax=Microbacterium allomyrinae TaxID=2830666 RepID=A0A9X1S3T6_9MICO|nr:hypothetical protein [Microbacterium allomyrinae]MCC2034061.1 hypothetical protein [Microbacterium allomyrinae]
MLVEDFDRAVGERSAKEGYEFMLVVNRDDYDLAVASGAQPILPSMRFSETDDRGALRRFLGPANRAWRWRRYFLNEGISEVTVRRISPTSLILLGGSLLSGTRYRVRR